MSRDAALTDALRAHAHHEWQVRICEALHTRGWQPPRYDVSGGPVPWEEVAALAVETLWSDLERIVTPIVELLAPVADSVALSPSADAQPSPDVRENPWLSADEAAPLLQTTAHSLRRLAREGRSPVLVRRIGGRWWFARRDLDRFIGATPAGDPEAGD